MKEVRLSSLKLHTPGVEAYSVVGQYQKGFFTMPRSSLKASWCLLAFRPVDNPVDLLHLP